MFGLQCLCRGAQLHLIRSASYRQASVNNTTTKLIKWHSTILGEPLCTQFFSQRRTLASVTTGALDSAIPKTAAVPSQDLEPRRKKKRVTSAKNSSKAKAPENQESYGSGSNSRIVTAYCAAEQYDLKIVAQILSSLGYQLDPRGTKQHHHVVHIQMPMDASTALKGQIVDHLTPVGDIFIFPSGTVVGWGVPEGPISTLASSILRPAAQNSYVDELETEDLNYSEDSSRETSIIRGDTITLGTRSPSSYSTWEPSKVSTTPDSIEVTETSGQIRRDIDETLVKIAFSWGLARSTKLAVLEGRLEDLIEHTKLTLTSLSYSNEPRLLRRMLRREPISRAFVLQKIGQILSIRAELNLYSELTDSLPDLFWDSPHELGLESYFDQVGRALDIGIRIKTLNEKINYSVEINSVLRDQLSEKHGWRLEWLIIALITVEVAFGFWREWREEMQREKLGQRT